MQHESARRPQVQGRREEGGFEAVSVGVSAAVAATPVWGLGLFLGRNRWSWSSGWPVGDLSFFPWGRDRYRGNGFRGQKVNNDRRSQDFKGKR